MAALIQAHLRHARHYLAMLRSAETLFEQGGAAVPQALELVDKEWLNLESAYEWLVAQADKDEAVARLCSDLPNTGPTILHLRLRPDEIIRRAELALRAAWRLGRTVSEGAALVSLGRAYTNKGQPDRAIQHLEEALALTRTQPRLENVCGVLLNLGIAHYTASEFTRDEPAARESLQRATSCFSEAKEIAHALNDRKREALLLGSLGNLYQRQNQLDLAERAYREQLAIAQERGDRRNESNALLGLANVLRRIQPEAASALYQQQLGIARELGDLHAEAATLFNCGLLLYDLGQKEEAIALARAALPLFERVSPKDAVKVRRALAEW
jgi:tetratricopeptide (TPR) repeat protein